MVSDQDRATTRVSYRIKLLLFALTALVVLLVFNVGYSAIGTLFRLDTIEAARDRWQRPADVIQALNLAPGETVVDLGSGSGYFTLKLSAQVGVNGRVIAEDIRTLPLTFLWMRKLIKGKRNVQLLLGDPDDPHLSTRSANAVLISNTYHEFSDARGILLHVTEALIPGGRLVVIDRAPNRVSASNVDGDSHEISSERVETELRQAKFEIVDREDNFIKDDPDHESWWIITARKP